MQQLKSAMPWSWGGARRAAPALSRFKGREGGNLFSTVIRDLNNYFHKLQKL
jgi:hypothetical protein